METESILILTNVSSRAGFCRQRRSRKGPSIADVVRRHIDCSRTYGSVNRLSGREP
jgi:hypothetical protein